MRSVADELESRGLKRGLAQGLEQGLEQGLARGKTQLLLRQLRRRFGRRIGLSRKEEQIITNCHDIERIEAVAREVRPLLEHSCIVQGDALASDVCAPL